MLPSAEHFWSWDFAAWSDQQRKAECHEVSAEKRCRFSGQELKKKTCNWADRTQGTHCSD